MQFPESWLRTFCNPPLTTRELADLLTMAGLEVEDLRPVAPPFSGVVVGEILTAEQHPSADRLRVCTVAAGSHSAAGPLQIVCGAPNARAGIKVPLALVGAELPPADGAAADAKPFKIGVGKLRGVESRGMLCSARELKIADDHGGLLELPAEAEVGRDIRAQLNLDDTVFTLKLTPNLAHALSVYGIAREVSALTGSTLLTPAMAAVEPQHSQRLPVQVDAADLCGRFSGRVIRGVDPQAATPAWMLERLGRCGQRGVSALVDISNYVMFEYGRPTHIFDLDKIDGGLVVRWAEAGETLELLNGQNVTLDTSVGVIADQSAVESLAGIMGGAATAVSDATRNVYVEAAFWWPAAVQGRSRRFNFSTDAGHRFERGVDPAQTAAHLEHLSRLILSICGGEPGPLDDQTLALPKAETVTLRIDRAARVIGMPLTLRQCADVFERLALPFTRDEAAGLLRVTAPSWRFDLKIEEDLIEEVVRVLGYDQLPSTPPVAPTLGRVRAETRRSPHALRRSLAALGYQETINYSFIESRWEAELHGNTDPIRVLNPIAAPLAVMRSSLIGGLVQVLRHNLARKAARVRVFELGRVFRRDADAADGPLDVAGVRQSQRIAGLAYGSADGLQWGIKERSVDFFDVKADVLALLAPLAVRMVAATHPALHPGRCALIEIDGRPCGFIGELHPKWRMAYELPQPAVLFELELDAALERPLPQFAPVARQQSVHRDLALVVADTVAHDALLDSLRRDPDGLIRDVLLFDIYKPATPPAGWQPGERSLAVRLSLRDDAATLTDERIDAVMVAALARVERAHHARMRA